jgi:regulator of sigma E protease
MEGEDEDTDNPRSFQKADWWKRIIILAAGSVMNLLTGIVIYCLLFLPQQQIIEPAIVEFTECCTFNTEDGLRLDDVILQIDGEKVYSNADISTMLSFSPDGVHNLIIERDGGELRFEDFAMTHLHENEDGTTYRHYGFAFGKAVDASLGQRMKFVWNTCLDNIRMVRLSLQMLFTGQAGLQDMSGPVGIVSQMSEIAEQSETAKLAFLNLLSVCAFIAINLAVMNLLPIPALDGGRVVALLITAAIEKVIGRKIDSKYEGYIHGAGMILLLGLMAVIMFKDIFVLMKG